MYCIVDIETTGGSLAQHKITEIAIIKTDGKKVFDTYHSLINPERGIPPWISSLTGITEDMVASAPKFYEVAKEIVEFTEGCVFVAHNVRFDYSYFKKEFGDLGYNFERKTLCTVRLSKMIIPGHKSYSLTNFCSELGLINERPHRALADAKVTTELFHLLFERGGGDLVNFESRRLTLPSDLPRELVEKAPEGAGVYYFYNKEGEVIYVGMSKNIRDRIRSHFQIQMTNKDVQFKNAIAGLSCELTGSELMAALLEAQEIKNLKPYFNRSLRRNYFRYGLFVDEVEGVRKLAIRSMRDEETPLIAVGSLKAGRKLIDRLSEDFDLERDIEQIIKKYSYPHASFLVALPGRSPQEKGFVCVHEGRYKGHGFLPDDAAVSSYDELKTYLTPIEEDRDNKMILLRFLKEGRVQLRPF